jgi:ParB-like chromosome segregation protein Spo0J
MSTENLKHASQIALWKHFKDQKMASKTDIVYIDPKTLVIEEGFNIRPVDQSYVDELAQAYLNGDTLPPLIVEILLVNDTPTPYVRDGHHRTHALLKAGIPQVAIIPFKGNREAAIALMFKSGSTRSLTRVQRATGVRRLRACNMSQESIAKLLGISQGEVSILEKIAMLPEAVKDMVEQNIVSATLAVDLHATHGSALYNFLQSRLDAKASEAETTEEGQEQPALLGESTPETPAKTKRAALTSKDLKPKMPKLAKTTLTSMESTLLALGSQLDFDRINALDENDVIEIKIDRSTAMIMSQLHAELEDLKAQKAAMQAELDSKKEADAKTAEEQIDLLDGQQ